MGFENVVLLYPHPYVAVYLEDNTGYTETYLTPESPVRMIQCGAFAEGRDNKLIYCSNYGEFIEEFGKPNFKLYGQPGYNIAAATKDGLGGAYVLRVLPDDAAHANVVVMAKFKTVSDGTVNKLSISYSTQTLIGLTDASELKARLAILASEGETPDDNGYYTMPLFCVYQAGRGVYGNNTRIRIGDVTGYDEDEEVRTYRLDVLKMGNTLERKEYAFGTFDQDLFDSTTKESLYLEDLVNDEENGLGKIRIEFCDDTFNAILNEYNTNVLTANGEETLEEIKTFDIIYGRTMTGSINDYIQIEEDSVSFTQESEGIALNGGDDGSLAIDSVNREEKLEELLCDAYAGKIDKAIVSKFASPADFMPDANFPVSVKRQMVALATHRQYNPMCYLDCGLVDTVDEAKAVLSSIYKVWNYNVCREIGYYKVRDTEYTGKTIPVTVTYFICENLPYHIKTFGYGIPFAMANARLTNAVKNSMRPIIDPDDNDIKKELYNLRGNYYENITYNVYQRGTANTTQPTLSDRMDEFNEYIIHSAVSIASDIMYGHLYNFGEPADRARYQDITNSILQNELGKYVRSCTIEYEMTQSDERKSILRLKLRIVFKTVVKRGIVEVYLDPRS